MEAPLPNRFESARSYASRLAANLLVPLAGSRRHDDLARVLRSGFELDDKGIRHLLGADALWLAAFLPNPAPAGASRKARL